MISLISCYLNSSFIEALFPIGRLPYFHKFENSFEVYSSKPTNVTKQVELISCYFTTSPAGRADGWAAGEINSKANSAQLSWDLG